MAAILTNVKGELRRSMLRDVLSATGERRRTHESLGLGNLDPGLYAPSVDQGFVSHLSQVAGPWALSGEYLPDYLPGEVEIARVVLSSTTGDVYSVRARRRGRGAHARLHYRMVDEYEIEITLPRRTSRHPLTLGQLAALIDGATFEGLEDFAPPGADFTDALRWGASECGIEIGASFVCITSELYPELEAWYWARANAWAAERKRELAEAWAEDAPEEDARDDSERHRDGDSDGDSRTVRANGEDDA
ncbi:MAG: hypothetical protein ACXW61_03235 [Gemmatirosa sp.]